MHENLIESIDQNYQGYQHKFNTIRNKKGELEKRIQKRKQKYGKNILKNY